LGEGKKCHLRALDKKQRGKDRRDRVSGKRKKPKLLRSLGQREKRKSAEARAEGCRARVLAKKGVLGRDKCGQKQRWPTRPLKTEKREKKEQKGDHPLLKESKRPGG